MSTLNFASEIANQVNTFESLPEGQYTVKVESAEVAPTSKGGQMIKVQFVVTEGKYKGRKLWNQFSIGEKSTKFLYLFLQAVNSPLIAQDNVTLEDIAASLKGAVCLTWATPSITSTGNASNNIGNFKPVATGTQTTGTASAQTAFGKPAGPAKPLFA